MCAELCGEDAELCGEDIESLPLPKDWTDTFRHAVLNVVCIVRIAMLAGREFLIREGDVAGAQPRLEPIVGRSECKPALEFRLVEQLIDRYYVDVFSNRVATLNWCHDPRLFNADILFRDPKSFFQAG